jgi:hypothetical protein
LKKQFVKFFQKRFHCKRKHQTRFEKLELIFLGTILLQEDPYYKNFDDSIKEKLKEILETKNLKKMLKHLEILHPTELSVVPKEELQVFELEYESLISEMLETTSEENKKLLSKEKLLKLILSLRFNGFQSGIYLHLSIFNHSW